MIIIYKKLNYHHKSNDKTDVAGLVLPYPLLFLKDTVLDSKSRKSNVHIR